MEIRKSVRGVKCHECGAHIRKDKQYYQYTYYEYHMRKYRNFCMECANKEAMLGLARYKRMASLSGRLARQYHKDDMKRCRMCQYRYQQVVGDCTPTDAGCDFTPAKEKKNDIKKSPKV